MADDEIALRSTTVRYEDGVQTAIELMWKYAASHEGKAEARAARPKFGGR